MKEPVLHFYSFKEPSATYGYFTDPFKFLDKDALMGSNISLARRPTGGGITFHLSDFAFSVLVPSTLFCYSQNTLENYAFVNNFVKKAVKKFLGDKVQPVLMPTEIAARDAACKSFCMARPTKYDVMIAGKKIGGAAQRQTKHGFLHQGTISIAHMSSDILKRILLPDSAVLSAMEENSYSLLGNGWREDELQKARKEMQQLLVESFMPSLLHSLAR
jgi:lipoate-protein ligase A